MLSWHCVRAALIFQIIRGRLSQCSPSTNVKKVKADPLQAWSGPEGSRKLRFPDFMTTAQNGGKVVGLTHRPPLPPGNTPGTHFCYRLSRPKGHSKAGRSRSLKNSNDTNGCTLQKRQEDIPHLPLY
jgi:hypothetical protein